MSTPTGAPAGSALGAAGGDLVACHDCDGLQRIPTLAPGAAARCVRCLAVLRRVPVNALNRALALTLASVVLYLLANLYPFMYFKIQGKVEVNHMISGVTMLMERGMPSLALVILMTSIVVPAINVLLLIYVLFPISLGRTPRYLAAGYRWLKILTPWGMLDVYLLGVLVAVVNLTAIASIELGVASYCFVLLLFATTIAGANLPHELIVSRMRGARS